MNYFYSFRYHQGQADRTPHGCKIDKLYEAAVLKHWTPQEKGNTPSPTLAPALCLGLLPPAAQRGALGNNHCLSDLQKQIPAFKVIKVIVGPTLKRSKLSRAGPQGFARGGAGNHILRWGVGRPAQRGLAEGSCCRTGSWMEVPEVKQCQEAGFSPAGVGVGERSPWAHWANSQDLRKVRHKE